MRNHCIIVSKEEHKQCAQYKQAEHADKHGEGGCSPVRQTCSRGVESNFPDQIFFLGSLALQNVIIMDGNPSGIRIFCLGLAYGIMQGFFETFFIKNMINKTLLPKITFKTINDDI